MKKVRFGVIGLKGIGRTHVDCIASLEETELTAVADLNDEVGKATASKYNVEWYKNYEDMLARKDLDAVSICTPHFLHFPMTIKSLRHGKHVLVEKPMAITVKEADRMIEAARRRNLKLGVAYQMRLNPVYQQIKKMMNENVIGRVYRVCMEACVFRTQAYYNSDAWRGRWSTEGGGALINQTIHHLDILQWLVGKPISVHGRIGTMYHNIEVEDVASAIMVFKNGAHGIIQVSTIDPVNIVRFEICGEKGKIIYEDGGDEIRYAVLSKSLKDYISSGAAQLRLEHKWSGMKINGGGRTRFDHRGIIRDFARAVLENGEPLVPGEEAIASLEIVNAIILSSIKGKPVSIPVNRKIYEDLLKTLSRGTKL